MADQQQLDILKSHVKEFLQWRKANPETQVDLSDANLNGEDLRRADLRKANLHRSELREAILTGVNLHLANLSRADLTRAKLTGSDLSYTDLSAADLSQADLGEANLTGADLSAANLSGADLRRANLNKATLSWTNLSVVNLNAANLAETVLWSTVFGGVDLSNATGLDSCVHMGPSILDHTTLMHSGPLPIAFLRGCGLPDSLIDYSPSLLGAAIQFYSCFISYSKQDQGFADRLHADLQNEGVRCWFAPHNIQGGKKIHEQIDEAIRVYDKLLLILSPDSMRSDWVQTEIAKARRREVRENRRMLFPIRLVDLETLRDWECFDADTGKDSAREIREYFIPDFSNWKTDHDAYTQAFERLLKDLRSEKAATA